MSPTEELNPSAKEDMIIALNDFTKSLHLSDIGMYIVLRYHRVQDTPGVSQFLRDPVNQSIADRIMAIIDLPLKKSFDDWYNSNNSADIETISAKYSHLI